MNNIAFGFRWSALSPTRWFEGRDASPSRPRPPRRGVLTIVLLFAAVFPAVVSFAAETAPNKLRVALYGGNGHQLSAAKFASHPHAQLVAIAGAKGTNWPAGVKRYTTLDEILADANVDLVSLCSPRRADQARDAIRCLEAGKHVYAEKPSALTEKDLDAILAAAKKSGKQFHEMAGTVFTRDYAPMRKLVREGAIGDVVQVFVQKSYKYGQARPQDEALDGGMFLQMGIHAARMVEHVGGVRMKTITGWETKAGSPEKGDGKIAGAVQIGLENGGIATIIMNYLNPGIKELPHGNETLRVFGTKGFIESVDGGARVRLVTKDGIVEGLDRTEAGAGDYFDFVAAHIAAGAAMPLTLEEELHPLRMLIRAKEKLREGKQ